jgi:hypothetical protein
MADNPKKPRRDTARFKVRDDDRRGSLPGKATTPQPHGGVIGQAPHIPTDETRKLVRENFAIKGSRWCAIQIGVCVDTITNRYKEEIAISNAVACAEIGQSLYDKAKGGDGASQRFFLITKGKGDWSPKIKHEHTGAGGGPIRTIDLTEYLKGKSDDELAILEQFLEQLAAAGGSGVDAGDLGVAEAG